MSETSFSVVIPTYNRADSICATVSSILQFAGNDVEIVVVNDGSTDNTLERLSEIRDSRLKIVDQENKERGTARNAGTLAASGNYITFLDSDDFLEPDFFSEAASFSKKNPDCSCFFMHYAVRTNGHDKTPDYPKSDLVAEELMRGNFLSCLAVVLKRAVARENLFSEDRRISTLEDWELWLRIAAKYGFRQHPHRVAVLMNHDERSVLKADKKELETKFSLFIGLVLSNRQITGKFQRSIRQFKASCYSYISLHLALGNGKKQDVARYWAKAFIQSPISVFSRRTLAIIKHIL